MLDVSELHQASAAKDALIIQLQTQQDELRRQLEQSETSRQKLKAENAQLQEQIAEWLANTPANPGSSELAEVIEKWMATSAGKAEQPRWKFVVALLDEIQSARWEAHSPSSNPKMPE
ncbi:hypothetical protein H6F93_00615 [Leptolyngbya sp. FACHB-671]|uniref:hypothetical protein n=1 Tax=Leptolyngbya sp. FACHB-671 TaxID=2692812 RepID=UPI00168A3E29|nr:hypothetical protein [Leptolyngbya sp. FACHB-671]MBD2066053.1 hypothetical protein [Leptolyngbya sp. FACHB-671]